MYENDQNSWQKRANDQMTHADTNELKEEISVPWASLLLWALLITFFSVLNPLFTSFATNLQSQELYTSWAMTKGQVAYTNIFTTSGVLFVGLSWLDGYLPFHLLLWIGELLALWVSGVATFRLSYHLTQDRRISTTVSQLFYGLVAILGLGGLYATVYALPFLLWMANFVIAYTRDKVSDRRFILYGVMGAVSFMIAPFATVVLAGIAFITLLVTNVRKRKKARGLYQLFASLFGFSLAFYPLAYPTVWNGSFGEAVGQIIFDLTNLSFYHSHFWLNLSVYLLVVFLLGIGYALLYAFKNGQKHSLEVRLFAGLGFILVWCLSLFNPDFGLYHFLAALPFMLILLALWQTHLMEKRFGGAHSRRLIHQENAWYRYLSSSHFLPILAMVLTLAYPLGDRFLIHKGIVQERNQIARYLQSKTQEKDRIYAWDTSASLYSSSQRLSAAAILSPSLYLTTSENRIDLVNSLQTTPPLYIVVNHQLAISKEVKEILKKDYQKSSETFRYFTLYQLKE